MHVLQGFDRLHVICKKMKLILLDLSDDNSYTLKFTLINDIPYFLD